LYGFAKVTRDLTTRRHAEQRIHELNKELRTRVAQLDESKKSSSCIPWNYRNYRPSCYKVRTMNVAGLRGSFMTIWRSRSAR
jgi:hypothetical protein